MNKTQKQLRTELRNIYVEKIFNILKDSGEEVLKIGSQQIAFPVVDTEGNEEFIKIVISVPTGDRAGEPFDGYGEAESYTLHLKEQEEKKKQKEKDKKAKIARDEKYRKLKAEQKEKRQNNNKI